jgi:GT2 family glycosyltransferase
MLVSCLESVASTVTGVSYEVIVVLNDPAPELSLEIEARVRGVTTFTFRANLGFGGAVNFAADHARGEYLVLLNDDCVVAPGWLESLVETAQRRSRCAAVGSTFLDPNGTLQEAGAVVWSDGTTCNIGDGTAHNMRFERRVDYCSGGSLLIRKNVWDDLGGFDSSYYPAYFEDVDFCLRSADGGWEVCYQPRSVVYHARWASTGANLRHHLWQRAHGTFVSRWSQLLESREPNGSLEQAVWRAMRSPTRVLVVGDEPTDPSPEPFIGYTYGVVTALAREPDVLVTFFPTVRRGASPSSTLPASVRVIDDLEEHVTTEGVDFDVVVVSHPHDSVQIREVLALHVPRARLVYVAQMLFHGRLSVLAEGEADPVRREVRFREVDVMRSLEMSLVESADCVVCASEIEADEVRRFTDTPVHVGLMPGIILGPRRSGATAEVSG